MILICDTRELQRFFKCDCVTWKNTERVRPHLLSGERSSAPKDRNCGIRGLVWCIGDVQESLWLSSSIIYFLTKKSNPCLLSPNDLIYQPVVTGSSICGAEMDSWSGD